MKIRLLEDGRTVDADAAYAARMIEHGKAVVETTSSGADAPPSPEGKAETETTSSGADAPPPALHGNNQPEQSSGVVPHPKGKAKKGNA